MKWPVLFRGVAVGVVLGSPLLGACAREPRPTLAPPPAPQVTSAEPRPSVDEVKDAIRRGHASLRSFRAEVVVTKAALAGETRATLEWTARGTIKDARSDSQHEQVVLYNAAQGSRVRYGKPADNRAAPTVLLESGVPPQNQTPLVPGDAFSPRPDPVGYARSVLAWDDVSVSRGALDGRAAWIVQRSSPGMDPDFQVITIDEESGLALRVQALNGGQPEYEVRVEHLVTNVEGEPSFVVPPGTVTRTADHRSRRMTLEQARRSAPFDPLVPAWLPAGFSQAEVGFSSPPSSAGQAAPSVVSVAFRRGLELFVVSTASRGTFSGGPRGRTVPPGGETPRGEGEPTNLPKIEALSLTQGPFAGMQAQRLLRTDGSGDSELTAMSDELEVTITGDLTLDEITKIAESLRPAA